MKPLVSIGCVWMGNDRQDGATAPAQQVCQGLQTTLSEQFPQFTWKISTIQRPGLGNQGKLDPLMLLERGTQEKVEHNWDYALVIVPNELYARDRIYTIGVPSSALEVAVLSTARFDPSPATPEQIIILALHLLGHLWGLEHQAEGPMHPPENVETPVLLPFHPQEQHAIVDLLEEVADARLEEQRRRWGRLAFYWQTFWADPKGIFIHIWRQKPWVLPLRMGRLTAAAAVSILLLLLGAETWEAGVNFPLFTLISTALLSIFIGAFYLFLGQNLHEISRGIPLKEQLARTHIVLFATVLVGMLMLWGVLFLVSYVSAALMPRAVTTGWTGLSTLGVGALARYAAFMATVGVLAGAVGGNLEDEDELKADLFYDEET